VAFPSFQHGIGGSERLEDDFVGQLGGIGDRDRKVEAPLDQVGQNLAQQAFGQVHLGVRTQFFVLAQHARQGYGPRHGRDGEDHACACTAPQQADFPRRLVENRQRQPCMAEQHAARRGELDALVAAGHEFLTHVFFQFAQRLGQGALAQVHRTGRRTNRTAFRDLHQRSKLMLFHRFRSECFRIPSKQSTESYCRSHQQINRPG
jgi:GNAT superfamily N-acetyltransferase